MKKLFIADLFLLFIFSNCDDKTFLDPLKAQQYQNKCQINFSLQMGLVNFYNYEYIQIIHNFLIQYDLIHSCEYSYDLLYFILNGKFYDWKTQNNKNTLISRPLKKDINADFYEGFN